jgi:hypothetical protein
MFCIKVKMFRKKLETFHIRVEIFRTKAEIFLVFAEKPRLGAGKKGDYQPQASVLRPEASFRQSRLKIPTHQTEVHL